MITAELTKKIDTLSKDEYHMVENYVDNVVEYSKRRNKRAAWEQVKSDLSESEKRMKLEGGINSKQLREKLGVWYVWNNLRTGSSGKAGRIKN